MGSNWSPRDTEYMRAALVEATVAAVEGEVPVGAVVVIDDDIVATGYNRIAQARVGRVVFAAYDKKAGALGSVEDLSDSRALNHRFEINGGLLADESGALLKEFFEARRRQ
jgi:tRNA(adenine34) deaminase